MLTITIHVTSDHPQYNALFALLRRYGFAVRSIGSNGFAVTVNTFSQGADVISACSELGIIP